MYEAFSLAFLTELNRASHPVIRDLISKGPGIQIAYQTVNQKVQQCKLEGFKERPAMLALQEFEMQGKVGRASGRENCCAIGGAGREIVLL